jgi:serine/threonine-protein kinase RsbW
MSEQASGTEELVLPSKLEALDRVDEITLKCTHRAGFDENTSNEVAIAVIEAVTNAVMHGNGESSDKEVKLICEWNPDSITVTVQDEGGGFDLKCIPDPTDPLHCLKCSGRGIYIMRATMDEVDFEISKGKGTTVVMKKTRPSSAESHEEGR